jgi:hypothetical protein
MIDQIESRGKKFEIATPFVPESKFNDIFELILKLNDLNKKFDLTINDYGILRRIFQTIKDRKFDLFMGHIYSTSFENCPWHDMVLAKESDFIKKSWCENSFTNDFLLQHVMNYGIDGIEIEMLPIMLGSSSKYFKEKGLKVKGLIDYIPSTVSRSCHQARYNHKTPSAECHACCDEPLYAKFTHKFSWEDKDTYVPIDEELRRKLIPNYILLGNMVYCKREFELTRENTQYIDEIMLDIRPFKGEDLKERVNEIRKLIG